MNTVANVLRHCHRCRRPLYVTPNKICQPMTLEMASYRKLSSLSLAINGSRRMEGSRCLWRLQVNSSVAQTFRYYNTYLPHQQIYQSQTFVRKANGTTSSSYSTERVSGTIEQPTNEDGDAPKNEKESRWSNWTGKNSWKSGLMFLTLTAGGMGATLIYSWGAPERDQDGEIIIDSYASKPTAIAYTLRAWYAATDFLRMVKAPTSEKLLPDPLVHPYIQPPYTVVLELSGLLLKPEWDMKMGWRFKKRPGLEYLLQTCAQSGYEVVIFTIESASVGYPLTISMDPQNIIWYRLFKEDTRYTSGVHIKDLTCLNRELSKVVLVDVTKDTFKLNPRNGIAVKKWDGTDTDRELYDLANFLQTVASNKVADTRTVTDYYNQFDDPMATFRENQAAVLKNHEELMKFQREEKKAQTTKSPFLSKELKRR